MKDLPEDWDRYDVIEFLEKFILDIMNPLYFSEMSGRMQNILILKVRVTSAKIIENPSRVYCDYEYWQTSSPHETPSQSHLNISYKEVE